MSSSNGEQVPNIISDRKKQSTILKMIADDCTVMYNYYYQNKDDLKNAIEIYEEFIIVEINRLFEPANSFADITHNHQRNFIDFMQSAGSYDPYDVPNQRAKRRRTDRFYVIYITVQDWLLHGQKGPQIYSMVDISAFKFYQQWDPSRATAQLANHMQPHVNGVGSNEKIASVTKYGEPAVKFLIFQNDLPFNCDAGTSNTVHHVHDLLKYKDLTSIECIPNKCAHFLLPKLFFGLNMEFHSTNNGTYHAKITVNNRPQKFTGDGITEQKAKNQASQRVLRKFCQFKAETRATNHGFNEPIFADKIENLVSKCCNSIKSFALTKKNRRNVIAAIVQTKFDDLSAAKVVVLASGTKGIDAEYMNVEGTVHDTHAEIVARRSLMVYFYDQLKMLCDEKNSENASKSIFMQPPNDSIARYKLKDGIQFHLFTSRAPCGDATAHYCKNNSEIGKLRVKVERKEGYLLVDEIKNEVQLAGAFHEGAVLYTACCSDKIARWNVVGIQGALLSRIIEPIYLDSITMNYYKLYKESDCIRAFYGRIENGMPDLPATYRHHKPKIAFATVEYKRDTQVEDPAPHSFNWIIGRENCEQIVSKTGLDDGCASRISKLELLKQFVNVMSNLPHVAKTSFDAEQTYDKMKAEAIDYNVAKEACIKAFKDKNLGSWIKVQKPLEIEKFTLEKIQ